MLFLIFLASLCVADLEGVGSRLSPAQLRLGSAFNFYNMENCTLPSRKKNSISFCNQIYFFVAESHELSTCSQDDETGSINYTIRAVGGEGSTWGVYPYVDCQPAHFCATVVYYNWNGVPLINYIIGLTIVIEILVIALRLLQNNQKALAGVQDSDASFLLSVHTKFLYVCVLWALAQAIFKCVTINPLAENRHFVHSFLESVLKVGFSVGLENSLLFFIISGQIRQKLNLTATVFIVFFLGTSATQLCASMWIDPLQYAPDPLYVFRSSDSLYFDVCRCSILAVIQGAAFIYQYCSTDLSRSRKAVLRLSAFLFSYYIGTVLSMLLRISAFDVGVCGFSLFQLFYFFTFLPLIYHILLLDSSYWRLLVGSSALAADKLLQVNAGLDQESDRDCDESVYVAAMFRQLLVPSNQMLFLKNLAHGSEGLVKLYMWRGTEVCVKCRHRTDLGSDFVASFAKETEIHRQLVHQHIVRFYGMYFDPPSIGIMLEYCEQGCLFDLLGQKHKFWSRSKSPLTLALDIAQALKYLHHKNLVHADVKSLNIMVNKDGQVKLADFGLSESVATKSQSSSFASVSQSSHIQVEGEEMDSSASLATRDLSRRRVSQRSGGGKRNRNRSSSSSSSGSCGWLRSCCGCLACCGAGSSRASKYSRYSARAAAGARGGTVKGSVPWISPEALQGQSLTCKSDVYSFAVLLWELVTWKQPFVPMFLPRQNKDKAPGATTKQRASVAMIGSDPQNTPGSLNLPTSDPSGATVASSWASSASHHTHWAHSYLSSINSVTDLTQSLLERERETKLPDADQSGNSELAFFPFDSRFEDLNSYQITELARALVLPGGRPPIGTDWPSNLKDLMVRCWSHSPQDRPDIDEVISTICDLFAEENSYSYPLEF